MVGQQRAAEVADVRTAAGQDRVTPAGGRDRAAQIVGEAALVGARSLGQQADFVDELVMFEVSAVLAINGRTASVEKRVTLIQPPSTVN